MDIEGNPPVTVGAGSYLSEILAAAGALEPDASFDFILTWDCLHDMTHPAEAMRATCRC